MTTRQKEQIQNLRLLGGGSNKNRCNFVWKSLLIFYFSMPPFNFSFTFMLTMLQPWYFWSSSSRISEETECSRDKLPFSFVRGQDSTMWDIVWVLPQGHRSDSASCHFLLQADISDKLVLENTNHAKLTIRQNWTFILENVH